MVHFYRPSSLRNSRPLQRNQNATARTGRPCHHYVYEVGTALVNECGVLEIGKKPIHLTKVDKGLSHSLCITKSQESAAPVPRMIQ